MELKNITIAITIEKENQLTKEEDTTYLNMYERPELAKSMLHHISELISKGGFIITKVRALDMTNKMYLNIGNKENGSK